MRGVGARRALPLRARCDRSARGGPISAGTGPASPRGGAAPHLTSRCAPGRPCPVLPAGEAPGRRAAVRARRCGRQRRERAGGGLGARRPERCLRVGVSQLVTSLREDRPAARKASLGGSRGTAWSCVFGGTPVGCRHEVPSAERSGVERAACGGSSSRARSWRAGIAVSAVGFEL